MNRTKKYRQLRKQLKIDELTYKTIDDKLDIILAQLRLLIEIENIKTRREKLR